jgi:hypothetical protein
MYERRIPRIIGGKKVLVYGYEVRESQLKNFYDLLTLICQDIWDQEMEGKPALVLPKNLFPQTFRNNYHRIRNDWYQGKWAIEAEIIED